MQNYSNVLYAIVFFKCFTLPGQTLDSSVKSQIQWHSHFETGFNSLSARFIKPWIYGGALSSTSIQKESAFFNPVNSGGFFNQHDVTYTLKSKLNKGHEIGTSFVQTGALQFSNDFFQLVFIGNTNNKIYHLAPLHVTLNQFQTLYYTRHDITKSHWQFSFGAGLCFGNRYINATAHSGSAFDNRNAQQDLTLYLNADVLASSLKQKSGFKPENGLGMELNGSIHLTIDSAWHFTTQVQHLGVMRWQRYLYKQQWDTLLYFDGLSFNTGKLEPFNNPLPDISESDVNTVNAFYTILPFFIHSEFSHGNTFQNIDTRIGLNYLYLSGYKPLFYLTQYFGHRHIQPSATIGYGGFSNTQYGLGLNLQLNSLQFELQSKALQSFIFTTSPFAFQINAQICYVF
jgi:hypothetical protein